jgi:hypothetical protein
LLRSNCWGAAGSGRGPLRRLPVIGAGRMKEFAALCERYQREVPGVREEIDRILEGLVDRRDKG